MPENLKRNITSIFKTLLDGVYIIDSNYNIRFMNDMMISYYGDGVGKKCHQLFHQMEDVCPWCQADAVFDGKTVRRESRDRELGKIFDVIEFPLKESDGTLSKVGIFRDITETKKREGKLRVVEEDYKRLLDHSVAGVYISSKEGKFLNANQALLDMLGYDSKEEVVPDIISAAGL